MTQYIKEDVFESLKKALEKKPGILDNAPPEYIEALSEFLKTIDCSETDDVELFDDEPEKMQLFFVKATRAVKHKIDGWVDQRELIEFMVAAANPICARALAVELLHGFECGDLKVSHDIEIARVAKRERVSK